MTPQTITKELRRKFEDAGETPERAEQLARIALEVRGMQEQPRMDLMKSIRLNNTFYKIITAELPSATRAKVFSAVDKILSELSGFTSQEGENVNIDMKTQARARGVSEGAIKMHDRICKALSFDAMPLTPQACAVYEWITEQDEKGQTIESFARWAKREDRVKFIKMYRKDAGNIKADWSAAFTQERRYI